MSEIYMVKSGDNPIELLEQLDVAREKAKKYPKGHVKIYKKIKDTDSKGDDIIQKALDEKIERVKQELTIFDDKENVDNIKNIINVLDTKMQHLKFFGILLELRQDPANLTRAAR